MDRVSFTGWRSAALIDDPRMTMARYISDFAANLGLVIPMRKRRIGWGGLVYNGLSYVLV